MDQVEFDPSVWIRRSRGHSLGFFAADEEVAEWFRGLPTEYGPYSVWGERRGKSRKYASFPLERWLQSLVEGRGSEFPLSSIFDLHAAKLMPPLPTKIVSNYCASSWGTVNGLLLVDHGAKRNGVQDGSRIAVVSKIENQMNGDCVDLKSGLELFKILKRKIKKKVCYASVRTDSFGSKIENEFEGMTEKAAQLARGGFFTCQPGRRLKP